MAGSSEKLSVYLHRAKGGGELAARAVEGAIDDADVYVFGELLDAEPVRALEASEHGGVWKLLALMAYGTYAEYKADTAAFPGMTPGRLEKLKQLSLVSLAESTRCLEYAEVCEALDLASDEELESLVVSCIYSGLIAASLDQRARQVEVQRTMGRDMRTDQLDGLLEKLDAWCDASDRMMLQLQQQGVAAQGIVAHSAAEQVAHSEHASARCAAVSKDIQSGAFKQRQQELARDTYGGGDMVGDMGVAAGIPRGSSGPQSFLGGFLGMR